ncbi:metallophosphoesterase family protein [Ktedonospora formicarum]|uniref:3',5'-cyclic adenosine monophosphate phosphodiesterase CpdA n=1 Tax=Ktedonospora formicarum TaxID=2778364 RepID=A0A8J3I8D0_9CHLR|nr:metallophosphoesterase [Ktedonospora formicarum]GHO49336.1 3',5'-cyclic adenosine monophosphate phosphodiesterase CpdA [Ktedonospora formicarum]
MTFSFVQITDHHIGETEEELLDGYATASNLRAVLRHISEHIADRIDFILTSGDLVNEPSEVSYANFAQILGLQMGQVAPGPAHITTEGLHNVPLYLLPGNHDDRYYYYRHLFQQQSQTFLQNASFQHKGIQFLCLDWGPQGQGIARPEMLDFLARGLKNGEPTILLTHHHLVPVGGRFQDSFLPEQNETFWELVNGHNNILGIFSGHAHVTYERVVGNIPIFGLRSTAPQATLDDKPTVCMLPPHYRLVTVHENMVTTRLFEVAL